MPVTTLNCMIVLVKVLPKMKYFFFVKEIIFPAIATRICSRMLVMALTKTRSVEITLTFHLKYCQAKFFVLE